MDDPFNALKNLSKPEIYVTIAGAGAIGGYFVYRHHASTGSWNPWSSGSSSSPSDSSQAGAANGTAVDPVTGLPYSEDNTTDPATGETYLTEANQYGSVTAAEASVSAYGQSTASGSGIPVNPASPASSGTVNTVVGTSIYTSNAAWDQAATAGLVDVGYNGTDVAAALGAYLTSTPLTPAQKTLVDAAISEYGPAPTGNLQVTLAPASGPGATTPVTAPSVENGKVDSVTQNTALITWTGNNATKYQVTINGPGKINGRSSTVTESKASFSGLQAGHTYTVTILPYNSSGTPGKEGSVVIQTLNGRK